MHAGGPSKLVPPNCYSDSESKIPSREVNFFATAVHGGRPAGHRWRDVKNRSRRFFASERGVAAGEQRIGIRFT